MNSFSCLSIEEEGDGHFSYQVTMMELSPEVVDNLENRSGDEIVKFFKEFAESYVNDANKGLAQQDSDTAKYFMDDWYEDEDSLVVRRSYLAGVPIPESPDRHMVFGCFVTMGTHMAHVSSTFLASQLKEGEEKAKTFMKSVKYKTPLEPITSSQQ